MKPKFYLTSDPIDPSQLSAGMQINTAGALSTFTGWVRSKNDGRDVTNLEYEAYEDLCGSEAHKILEEARQKFNILNLVCVHRVGKLNVGDTAVWVGAASEHRDDAFQACRFVIDEVKARLPIWKKEYYLEGDSGWVNCSCTNMVRNEH